MYEHFFFFYNGHYFFHYGRMFFSCREASLLLKTWITANSKTYGVDHVETLAAKRYHAVCLGKLGKDEEAAVVFKEILNRSEQRS